MIVPLVSAVMLLLPLVWASDDARAIVLVAAVSMVLLFDAGRHCAKLHLSLIDELPTLLGRLLLAGAVAATPFALMHEQGEVAIFLGQLLLSIALVLVGRMVTTMVIQIARRHRVAAHRTITIGGGVHPAAMATLLKRYPQDGLVLVGFVDDGSDREAGRVSSHLGRVSDLEYLVPAPRVDVLLMADGDLTETEILDVVRRLDCLDCDLLVIPRMPQFRTQVGVVDHVGFVPVMCIRNHSLEGPAGAVKWASDVIVSACTLVLLAPVMLACAIAVRLGGGPGVLLHQERVGRHGQEFLRLKVRSMRPTTEIESATRGNIGQDKRVGRVGTFPRRTSLDELPQQSSILACVMTLVGPRPERPRFLSRFSAEVDRHDYRHHVRAGLAGLARVSRLRGDTPINDRVRFDTYYTENWSLWLDAKVILRTFAEVLFDRGR